jgi:hypothetical protein
MRENGEEGEGVTFLFNNPSNLRLKTHIKHS